MKYLFSTGRLKLSRLACAPLIKQITNYEWADTINERTDPNSDDDGVDALRYLVQMLYAKFPNLRDGAKPKKDDEIAPEDNPRSLYYYRKYREEATVDPLSGDLILH